MNKLIFDTTEKIGEKCKQLSLFSSRFIRKEKALKLNIPVGTAKSRWNAKKIRLTMLSMNKDLIKLVVIKHDQKNIYKEIL